ncbi:MAG: tyrosine-type recombinase/integrase [Streptosporangiales bacterium]|nr:tyrosine-type recombinase/integrase [Streptosporangiales bacterium]
MTALRRRDIDLEAATVQVRVAYAERPTGEMLLGPPKSDAGVREVGIPRAILPAVRGHLDTFVKPEPDAIVFPGPKGGPMRRSGFNKLSAWVHVVRAMGLPGLHVRDLRHTGNTFAAESGAALRDLMARLGQSSTRAAIIYQHRSQGPTSASRKPSNDLVSAVRKDREEGDDGAAGALVPAA